ncbi:hypothetical protein O9X98_04625 [Agrobacterium salinitolerans]|nr:hypothetical protein [Agrobacterium salinitolerans]
MNVTVASTILWERGDPFKGGCWRKRRSRYAFLTVKMSREVAAKEFLDYWYLFNALRTMGKA